MNKKFWDTRAVDEIREVSVQGYKVITYSIGEGEEIILCLNGGPGAACDYIRDSHSFLADHGYRLVAFDQLGTGASDRPDDTSLWNIGRYAEEVEEVRMQLNLGKVHLLGQSWGGWLAIEYCATHLANIKTLVLENTCADMPHLREQLPKLRSGLGAETLAMMESYEEDGLYFHPEYRAAITLLDYRHSLRLREAPEPVVRTGETFNRIPYEVMQGPNEYYYKGNLKNWSRLEDLNNFHIPTLITVGEFDLVPPACSELMLKKLPMATLQLFKGCSHQPFFENPELFQEVLLNFYSRQVVL